LRHVRVQKLHLFSLFIFMQNITLGRFSFFQKALVVVGMALFALSMAGCSFFDSQRAGSYNEEIVGLQKEILDKVDGITPMLNQQDVDIEALKKARQELSDLIKTNTQKLEAVQKMSDDAGFYDATLTAFKAYQGFVDGEMAAYFDVVGEMLAMDKNASEGQISALQDREKTAADNFEKALQQIDDVENKAVEAQKAFAEKYDITLI